MFSSVNFLFLTSLAITSWIILCYFKKIEEQREEHFNIDATMESTFEESLKKSCYDNYDIYLNFICIFACIYALAKITHLTENYVSKHMQAKFASRLNNKASSSSSPTKTPPHATGHARVNTPTATGTSSDFLPSGGDTNLSPDLQQQQKYFQQQHFQQQHNLLLQIAYLESENLKLEQIIRDIEERKQSANCFRSDDKLRQWDNQNVYITNSHLHLPRKAYLSESSVKMNYPLFRADCNGGGVGSGDFSHVWGKYLLMQKFALQKPNQPQINQFKYIEMAIQEPIVVSTEDLEEAQGFFF